MEFEIVTTPSPKHFLPGTRLLYIDKTDINV